MSLNNYARHSKIINPHAPRPGLVGARKTQAMSSLLQFNGKIGKNGVGLEFYKTVPKPDYTPDMPQSCGIETERIHCVTCGRTHAQLYRAYRKPAGMFGCWVVFRWNGTEHVPDLSIPIATYQLPKDAVPLTDIENAQSWHRP